MLPVPPKIAWPSSALFLDVDGTLLDIVERPEYVTADPALVATLQEVAKTLGGAMALISGRRVTEVNRIFHPARFPTSGAHGAEYQDSAGRRHNKVVKSLPAAVIREIQKFADSHRKLLLEHKQYGVALHYRQAPELQSTCHETMNSIAVDVEDDFRLIDGKMVYELTPRSVDKGMAVAEFLRADPFRGRKPVYVGDDTTDEDGFIATNRLSGTSIRVGQTQRTEANFVLEDVDAVRRWLEYIVGN